MAEQLGRCDYSITGSVPHKKLSDCKNWSAIEPEPESAMDRASAPAPIPMSPLERETLIVRQYESLAADVARNHELIAGVLGSLENRIMEQQRYGVMLAELEERQRLTETVIADTAARVQSIEAQLTALRADADKGREALERIVKDRELVFAWHREHECLLAAVHALVSKGPVTHKRNLHLGPVSRKKRKR